MDSCLANKTGAQLSRQVLRIVQPQVRKMLRDVQHWRPL